jgi:hypothetical protein
MRKSLYLAVGLMLWVLPSISAQALASVKERLWRYATVSSTDPQFRLSLIPMLLNT